MKRLFLVLTVLVLGCTSPLWAWDCYYDCSVLPLDSSHGIGSWTEEYSGSVLPVSTDGNILRLGDGATAGNVYFAQNGIGTTSFTVEARLKVVGSSNHSAEIFFSKYPALSGLNISSSQIDVNWRDPYNFSQHDELCNVDMTDFHTIRMAINQGAEYVWIDGNLLSMKVLGNYNSFDVYFGSSSDNGNAAESYWDYFAYSNSFVPIPEPSSLLVLAGGLLPIGVGLMRRITRRS